MFRKFEDERSSRWKIAIFLLICFHLGFCLNDFILWTFYFAFIISFNLDILPINLDNCCCWHPTFLRSKKKKGNKGKKENFKAETIKRLSLKLKRYYFSHSRVSRILADNTFQCSMAPPLWNSFLRRSCFKHYLYVDLK